MAPSPKGGRGIFTAESLDIGDVIEISPVIVLTKADLKLIHQTHLHDYYFLWDEGQCAIALGYGSLYNHATEPNAEYRMNYADKSISFFCIQPIASGEEITINYVEGGNERGELWF